MTERPRVALIAEVGHRVGWGHVSRCMILRDILSRECDVVVRIVNREPWEDPLLEKEFAYQESLRADVVFIDGLMLRDELSKTPVFGGALVSLSYMSDLNSEADLVVAPALNGMPVPEHYVTDLEAILCNRPSNTVHSDRRSGQAKTIGISMGGADVEGMTPILRGAMEELGYDARTSANSADCQRTLPQFLSDKLRAGEADSFPYYSFSGCDLVVCQGGLSSIEMALLGIPTVIRSRSDFTPAYGFLEASGCALRYGGKDIDELVDVIANLCEDACRRADMVRACSDLSGKIRESFWMKLVHKLTS